MSLAKIALKSISMSLKTRLESKIIRPDSGAFDNFNSFYGFYENFMNCSFDIIDFLCDDDICLLYYVSHELNHFKDIFFHAVDTINKYRTSADFLFDDPNCVDGLIFDINWILNDIDRS